MKFDDIAAPIIYTSAGQLAAVAPFGIAGQNKTSVTVLADGKPSGAVTVPVSPTNPAIFTANSTGSGHAADPDSHRELQQLRTRIIPLRPAKCSFYMPLDWVRSCLQYRMARRLQRHFQHLRHRSECELEARKPRSCTPDLRQASSLA